MGIVKIIISIPGKKVVMKESRMNPYFDNEEKLVKNIADQGGRLSVFLDGWYEILCYPEKRRPVADDKLISVVLDKVDEIRDYKLYESEFQILSEIWREKEWEFIDVDMSGNQQSRQNVLLDGWVKFLPYPEKRVAESKDRLLSVVLDKGNEKRSYELYESEFQILSETWKEKKWGFSAVDLFGNTVALEEYDYISRLQEAGSIYAGSRKIYSMSHDTEISVKKEFFREFTEGLKRDYGWLLRFQPLVILGSLLFLIILAKYIM